LLACRNGKSYKYNGNTFLRGKGDSRENIGTPILDRKTKKECALEVLRRCAIQIDFLLTYLLTVIAAAIAQWHSRLNACVRVNGGHFEHNF